MSEAQEVLRKNYTALIKMFHMKHFVIEKQHTEKFTLEEVVKRLIQRFCFIFFSAARLDAKPFASFNKNVSHETY